MSKSKHRKSPTPQHNSPARGAQPVERLDDVVTIGVSHANYNSINRFSRQSAMSQTTLVDFMAAIATDVVMSQVDPEWAKLPADRRQEKVTPSPPTANLPITRYRLDALTKACAILGVPPGVVFDAVCTTRLSTLKKVKSLVSGKSISFIHNAVYATGAAYERWQQEQAGGTQAAA